MVEVEGAAEGKVEEEAGLEEDKEDEAEQRKPLQEVTATFMATVHTAVGNVVRQDQHTTIRQLSPT